MEGIFDPALFWLPCGIFAFVFAIANIFLILYGKKKQSGLFIFLSLSFGSLSLLSEYLIINKWVQKDDFAAIEDVVPGMSGVLFGCVLLGILLNGFALFLASRKK